MPFNIANKEKINIFYNKDKFYGELFSYTIL